MLPLGEVRHNLPNAITSTIINYKFGKREYIMDKLAIEKIASHYYNLGLQLAIEQAGLQKTAKPKYPAIDDSMRRNAMGKLPINAVPYADPQLSDVAGKNNMSTDEVFKAKQNALGDAGAMYNSLFEQPSAPYRPRALASGYAF